jgi:hypothetical protein
MSRRSTVFYLLLVWLLGCEAANGAVFDTLQIPVAGSPAQACGLDLAEGVGIVDFDVARTGPLVAMLVREKGGFKVRFWGMGAAPALKEYGVAAGVTPSAVAWRPEGGGFFLAGSKGRGAVIIRVDANGGQWSAKTIFSSPNPIRRLVPCPRPFAISMDTEGKDIRKLYRLFFGMRNPDGSWSVRSVTEDGGRDYQAVGPGKWMTTAKEEWARPSTIVASFALPEAFHPAGNMMIWQDEHQGFNYAVYARDHWDRGGPLACGGLHGGSITPTPNGAALIYWRHGTPGVTIVSGRGTQNQRQATALTFLSTPSSVPDGRGIVGVVKKGGGLSLVYVPIEVPLANVANAWMFVESPDDSKAFSRNGGLFRQLDYDQLYSMYDSEAYQCGQYDPSTPTRPYLVTTDVFWELVGAANDGMFVLTERRKAVPAFWQFVDDAGKYLAKARPDSRWTRVFATLAAFRAAMKGEKAAPAYSEEIELIKKASGSERSSVLGRDVDFGELKPRGHYTSGPDMETYFKAFQYMVRMAGEVLPPGDIESLPAGLKDEARAWIASYEVFIAPGRFPLVWSGREGFHPPSYGAHPLDKPGLFPLAWGFDNEVLLSTVFHPGWPESEQIKGPQGPRLVPSGLDLASVLGSRLAATLLAPDIQKYPPLKLAMAELGKRFAAYSGTAAKSTNIYESWLSALAVQWADDVVSGKGPGGRIWAAKRLQTGLASWATLRHASVLVNDRTAAECGEAGFEPIIMTPPRGYVEPDPKTFEAIARVLDVMRENFQSWGGSIGGRLQLDNGEWEEIEKGVSGRLRETADKARLFAKIALKETRGEPLDNRDYEEILHVGAIAEHNLLVFESMANKNFGLSAPDPMPKIADVAGGGPAPLLMAAVGRPLEWDFVVPFFGQREIVKGAVYSYYEFTSQAPLNDVEWRKMLPGRPHPGWIEEFMSKSAASCPVKEPY